MRPRRCALTALLWLATPTAALAIPLQIEGAPEQLVERVRDAAGIEELACDARRWVIRRRAEDLRSVLRRGLRARGHYSPEIDLEIVRTEDCLALRIRVEQGPAASLRRFDAEIVGAGATDPQLRAALAATPLAVGEPFTEGAYEALKSRLQEAAEERGYFDATFEEARVEVWPEAAAVEVDLTFGTGPRYALGEVHFSIAGDPLADELLQRFVDFTPGTPYTSARVDALRRRLLDAGYFDAVDVITDVDARANGRAPIQAELAMRPRHELNTGAGFATDLGPRVRGGYHNRYVTRTGHQAKLEGHASTVVQEVRGEWRMPRRRADSWLSFDAGYQQEDTDTSESRTLSAGVRHLSSLPSGWRMTLGTQLSREKFEVAQDDDTAVLLMPSVTLRHARQRQPGPFEAGHSVQLRLQGAAEPLATASFLQLVAGGRYAHRLGEDARVLARVDAGTTLTDPLAELPASVRFFAGGDESLRGHDFRSLGPRDAFGEVEGGRHLLTGSLSYERRIVGRWAWAVFADAGSAFNDFDDDFYHSAGIGLRWHSPVGPIKVDLGFPLDDADRGEVRLHFGIGSSFR